MRIWSNTHTCTHSQRGRRETKDGVERAAEKGNKMLRCEVKRKTKESKYFKNKAGIRNKT